MSKRATPATRQAKAPSFTPVAVRARRDGWSPDRQLSFIQALAATGCVEEAARSVGMSARSARDLRTRSDAAGFRTAWDAALGAGVQRLAEAALSRAIHGVAQPIFYKGEQVGERIRHDERLTAFLLRYHLPHRYGAWRDRIITEQNHPDGRAMILQEAVRRMVADCIADMNDRPRVAHPPLVSESRLDDPAVAAAEADAQARLFQERRRVEWADFERRLSAERAGWEADARHRNGRGSSAGDGSSAPAAEGKSASAAT